MVNGNPFVFYFIGDTMPIDRCHRACQLRHRATLEALKRASHDAIFDAQKEADMRTTVTLDDELVSTAREYVDIRDTSGLLREALESLIEREAARRLSALGGSEPQLELPPRRRASL